MEEFYATLKEIHEKQNISLPREAILGGQKMDLYKIYLQVTNSGGFHKVTADRGWKRISDSFNLSSTCTNSAYVFKQLYKKHLLVYELMMSMNTSLDEVLKLDLDKFEETNRIRINIDDNRKFQVFPKVNQFPVPYLDETGDDRFLQGGWQNRLALALKSHLPNEVDWAFKKLIKLSFQHNFYVGFIPTLPETLLEHCAPFFDQLELNTSPSNFETSLHMDQCVVPQLTELTMFNIKEQHELLERVLQVLHIVRNMSFLNENAIAFSRDHKLLTVLAKSMALPSSAYYLEVQQYSLDIFENVARLLVLRGTSDFYLACLKKMIFENDRAHLLSALKCLIKLASNELNEKVILQIDTPVLQRLLQLLLVPDEEIVTVSLEFFYLFTNISPDAGARITGCVRFNILELLLKFAYWKGLGKEVRQVNVLRNELTNYEVPPAIPLTLNPKAVDPFHAAIWLQTKCIEELNSAVPVEEFYGRYCSYCALNVFNPIPLPELLKLTQKFYKEAFVSAEHGLLVGIILKYSETKSSETPFGMACGILSCTDEFDSYPDLKNHVLEHNNRGVTCNWKNCNLNCKNKKRLRMHVLTHIPQDITPATKTDEKMIHAMTGAEDGYELKGIPLCALLVIRNIAKNPQNHHLFTPYERDLASMLAFPLFSKTVANVFVELNHS